MYLSRILKGKCVMWVALLLAILFAGKEVFAITIPKEVEEIARRTDELLAGKTFQVTLKDEMGTLHWGRFKGPNPNRVKLIIDSSGRMREENGIFITGKLTPIHPGGRIAMDEKGRLVDTRFTGIALYDGKYYWSYDPHRNTFKKEKKDEAWFQKWLRFRISFFALTTEVLKRALPQTEKISVKRTVLEGKSALLVILKSKYGEAKYWVDAENYFPLGAEFIYKEKDGPTTVMRNTVLEFKLNPSLPKDIFIFTPPKGAREIS